MSLRIVIIEDEPAISRNLSYIIKDIEHDAQVVNTLTEVKESVDWFNKNSNNYDLIFSDIQLSDGLSFNIFKQTQITVPVIFITAFNEYALDAFKANGIDYILKPFDESAVQLAIAKYKNFSRTKSAMPDISSLINLIQNNTRSTAYKQSLLVHYRDKLIPVNINDVCFFYSKNEVSHAFLSNMQYVVDDTLEKLQQQLNPAQFFRANRQFIINRTAVKEAHFYFNGRLLIKTTPEPPEQILISKARVALFKEWMNS